MSRQARFEVVRTNAGWHGRFRAKNGRVVWTTEVYTRSAKVIKAINVLALITPTPQHVRAFAGSLGGVRDMGHGVEVPWFRGELLEVRTLDERAKP